MSAAHAAISLRLVEVEMRLLPVGAHDRWPPSRRRPRPEFIRRGVAIPLLDWSLRDVWRRHRLPRVWFHTRDRDHPHTVRPYDRAGSSVYQHDAPEPSARIAAQVLAAT